MQYINTGSSPNSGDGDSLRVAFGKINANFLELTTSTGFIGSGGFGYTGSSGEVGYTGSLGEVGYTGSAGSLGEVGYTGSAGVIGYTGSSGFQSDEMTITGQRISGQTRLELAPTNTTTDQYIILDNFNDNLIAIRPGGLPDSSTVDLNLGSNLTNIKISDQDESVSIKTTGDSTHQWKFNNQGHLIIPENSVMYSTGFSTIGYFQNLNSSTAARASIGFTSFGIMFSSNQSGNPPLSWSFTPQGGFQFPDETIQTTAFLGNKVQSDGSNIEIITNYSSTPSKWIFSTASVLTTPGHIIPNSNNSYDLGSTSSQWRSLYVSTNTIYIGGIPIGLNTNSSLTVNGVPVVSYSTSGNFIVNGNTVAGGGGLPTITIPATPVVLYKGLQASYGVVHSNNNSNELNVNKIVIHKPATTTSTIDPTGSQDNFQVSGLGSSDVLAMFVVYGDTNGAKPLSTLQNFVRSVIDNVILEAGVEGAFLTVDEMKTAFYANYATLASAAGGLYTNFQFYQSPVPTLNSGPTTTREGSGIVDFTIFDNGNGTYTIAGVSGGTNYLIGHKIKILGTAVGGATPDNDIIVTVVATNGEVVAAQEHTGLAAGNTFTQYFGVTGTNYQVGSGFTVNSVYSNGVNVGNYGSGYVVGDVLTLLGENITNGTTPTNDITLTVTSVGGSGEAYGYTFSGTIPDYWPTNNISDGGVDQYDTANYINTNLANEINYNSGNTVVDGTAEFGTGSTYSFVYDTAIFGLFVTGNSATLISTSGNSGADGGSTTETGYVFGGGTAEQTFDNAVTHINLVGDPYAGEAVSFLKTDNGNEVDILIPDDGAGAGVGITRDGQQGIYNPYREGEWDSDVSPGGTLWNIDGWANLSDVESRTYTNLYAAFGNGGLGNKIVGTECVMYLPDNGKYYAVKFTQWTQGAAGGGFAYTRRELDLTSLAEGIRFADGTVLKSAEGIGRVKLRSPGNRRIEEVYGYKAVSVTSVATTNLTTTASRNATGENRFWVDSTATTIDTILDNTTAAGIWDITTIEFSLDNTTWYKWSNSTSSDSNERGYSVTLPSGTLNYNQGDTIYFRYNTGGEPVVWWDSADLPGGSSNFRGAIIKYHAYITDSGSMVGTIHIAKDSGDENIFHTEVLSGGTDGENAILWHQDNENQIKYKRIDGEGSTAKIQWSATVFYGSEVWD